MIKRRDFLTYSLLVLGGCAGAKSSSSNSAAIPKPEKLRFTVTDIAGLDELEQNFGEFRQTLTNLIDIPVEFFPVENYLAAAPALLANELDLAIAGPSEYLLLRARAQAVPVVGITRPDYYTMILTLAESGIQTVADLKGKKIAMRTEGSTAGHIVPMQLLLDAGLKPQGDFEVLMLGDDSLTALLKGDVDAWAESSIRYAQFSKDNDLKEGKLKILTQSADLPPDVLVANPNLNEAFVQELQEKLIADSDALITALLTAEANQKYRDSSVIVVKDDDYETLRSSYYAIGQGSAIE